ncbi:transcriptional regulator [Streptacidiphilus pinicola]|uniref:Transcriptional regulator n=1 Tax=Streptacidiphilus pinicola TaxID=2219663 RepID=A0A2X0KGA2_9ACTN|nr:transcriptional regulator [Streptacidiphilus pinicola]
MFEAVDALLNDPQASRLPAPAERTRLREAAGLPPSAVAQALATTAQTVRNWENGRSEPRPPRRQAYQRLLETWSERFPAPATTVAERTAVPAVAVPPRESVAAVEDGPASEASRSSSERSSAIETPVPRDNPVGSSGGGSRCFPSGPLAVLDGDGTAYGAGGVKLRCPATTPAQLVAWALTESGLGSPRLHRFGREGDPLVVLTTGAAERLGLPGTLRDEDLHPGRRLPAHHVDLARRTQRLPEDHRVVRQLRKAKWELTKRGFGPWARIYRPVKDGRRQCVQLAIVPWGALDERFWGDAATLPAPDLARVLGVYAVRVLTPRGSTAVTGMELMTALRPPSRPVRDPATCAWVSGANPGALTAAVDPAPPEATPDHPVAEGWTKGFLDEEACQWIRPIETVTDEELVQPYAVGLDLTTAFLSAASRLDVGLSAPVHENRPRFDKRTPGSWYVDLSGIDLDPRLPNPFTSCGKRPEGPAWYATPTVAYAQELGHDVQPIEAFLRHESGPYLDPWHDRLREAYVTTVAEAGIPVGKDADERAFLAALAAHQMLRTSTGDLGALRRALQDARLTDLQRLDDDRLLAAVQRHREIGIVLSAIKGTVKGGIGKLRERAQGVGHRDFQRWPALNRPTWRPDIRAAVISRARVNMHRKMANVAKAGGRYPLGVLSDCVVYAAPTPDPLGVLPLTGSGRVLPGTFRLGAAPGLAKPEGVQAMLWAVELLEHSPQPLNPARHIKGGDSVLDEGE